MAGGLPGQLFGKTTLAGKPDQPGRRIAGGGRQVFARLFDLAFLAPTVQVQQPAGDEEQRHQRGADHQYDPPDDPEVTADVQRVDAGQQLRLEAFVTVAIMPLDNAGGRVEPDLVQCPVMG
ncbi:hypothetical protein D3C85_838270 [compost metagenome]